MNNNVEGIHIVKLRPISYLFSVTIITLGLLSILVLPGKGLKLSHHFVGGVKIQAAFSREIKLAQLRDALKPYGLAKDIQVVSKAETDDLWRFNIQKELTPDGLETVKKEIMAAVRNMKIVVDGNEFTGRDVLSAERPFPIQSSVGPSMGESNMTQTLYVILAALALLIVYISIRFKPIYAAAAIVALVHDVMISIGILSLAEKEIDTTVIAAVLTIIGYSLNDTIVVFDRIRENNDLYPNRHIVEIIVMSIRQTLSRTLITSITTLIAVISLFVLGPSTINTFSFTLIIGVMIGTYSSIFIASAVLLEWSNFRHKHIENKSNA